MYVFTAILMSVLAFLLGSVPFGLVIAKTFCGIDPRKEGSCNVGATNVSRLCGFKWGVATLACDILKGFLPVLLYIGEPAGSSTAGLYWFIGLFVVLGHMFSVFLKFKGGKGVATTVGVFLACAPWALVAAAAACILVIWRSGYVSAGSLTLAAALPLIFLFTAQWSLLLLSLIIGALIFYAHRGNIRRLLRGEEKSWLKSKDKA